MKLIKNKESMLLGWNALMNAFYVVIYVFLQHPIIIELLILLDKKEIERQLDLAEVDHSLSFEHVADEIIEEF